MKLHIPLFLIGSAVSVRTFAPPLQRKAALTQHRMIGSILDLLGGGSAGLISPDDALKGRPQKMANIDGLRHFVLGNKLEEVPDGYQEVRWFQLVGTYCMHCIQ